ncbi:MAG: hypothetical protein K2X38_15740 [Gemmataceae bacterium]|nr:hypothetical protein [Gemmataceae bacterium]
MVRKILFGLVVASLASFAIAQDPVTERPGQPATATPVAPAGPAAPAAVRIMETPPAAAVRAIPGSCWVGTEELNQNGKLHFGLKKDGTAVMIDAQSAVTGRYVVEGDRVTLTFTNCVYRGVVRDGVMTGDAVVTAGANRGMCWKYQVRFADPFAGASFQGQESLDAFGAVTFRFGTTGEAEMIDAQSRVRGSYAFDVDEITIRFKDCVYVGRLLPNGRIAGTARYTTAQNNTSWTFNVERVK